MVESFNGTFHPARVIFGAGSLEKVAEEIRGQGGKAALILSTPSQKKGAENLASQIGNLAAGVFSGAQIHTPITVTETAMTAFVETEADCVVSLGGGSTIGLGKAIAYRTDCPQIVVATTYAGSEMTPVLGQTKDGMKTTVKDPRILPEVAIYDPSLTLGLPLDVSIKSGLNAMAHAVEAVYAKDRNPVSSMQAVEGVRALRDALTGIVRNPQNLRSRTQALYGSWLCGTVLGTVGMALHHKLCHVLGGSFDLPHSDTHAILLPHTAAFNAPAAAEETRQLAALFGGTLGGGLWEFAKGLGAPLALKEIGLTETDLDRAADLAIQKPYWNPRPVNRGAIREILQCAWEGTQPKDWQ